MRSLVIIMHDPDQRHTLHFILSVLQGIVRLFHLFLTMRRISSGSYISLSSSSFDFFSSGIYPSVLMIKRNLSFLDQSQSFLI